MPASQRNEGTAGAGSALLGLLVGAAAELTFLSSNFMISVANRFDNAGVLCAIVLGLIGLCTPKFRNVGILFATLAAGVMTVRALFIIYGIFAFLYEFLKPRTG